MVHNDIVSVSFRFSTDHPNDYFDRFQRNVYTQQRRAPQFNAIKNFWKIKKSERYFEWKKRSQKKKK